MQSAPGPSSPSAMADRAAPRASTVFHIFVVALLIATGAVLLCLSIVIFNKEEGILPVQGSISALPHGGTRLQDPMFADGSIPWACYSRRSPPGYCLTSASPRSCLSSPGGFSRAPTDLFCVSCTASHCFSPSPRSFSWRLLHS